MNTQTNTARRWVIKIGSALLTGNGAGLAHAALDEWVSQIAELKSRGHEIVLVSSGAVAEGMTRLGWQKRPSSLHRLQAAAAVGQAGLIQAYEKRFQNYQLQTAQILLVDEDLFQESSRTRYLNARQTLQSLLGLDVIPIVNENDTIATDEIRYGDNDTLAGLVSNLIDADTLLILTDQDGLFNDDPRTNANAQLISQCDINDPLLDDAAKDSRGNLGRGGMTTKIKAARLAARSGATTIIANGLAHNVIQRLANNDNIGTRLTNTSKPITARKQWLAAGLKVRGKLTLDDGAVTAITESGRSLLPVGIKAVEGKFPRGELVSCINAEGNEIARGLVNYNYQDAIKIAGLSSKELASRLGYGGDKEMIHRDNLVIL